MIIMSKCSAILLLSVLVSSTIMMSGLVCASTPKPLVPEFTVKIVDHSYYVPIITTNYTNPYTGQQETKTSGGNYVEKITVDVAIRNQPFIPMTVDGNTTGLFYVIRWKGHYEDWFYYGSLNDVPYENSYPSINYAIPASTSDITVKSYSLSSIGNIPKGGEVDFQVKAQIGFSFLYFGGHIQPIGTNYHWVEESDWSAIQTITIANSTPSTTPSSYISPSSSLPESQSPSSNQSNPQTSTQSGNDWVQLAIVVLFGVVAVLLSVAVALQLKRRKKI